VSLGATLPLSCELSCATGSEEPDCAEGEATCSVVVALGDATFAARVSPPIGTTVGGTGYQEVWFFNHRNWDIRPLFLKVNLSKCNTQNCKTYEKS
jgi:hypothetical protein